MVLLNQRLVNSHRELTITCTFKHPSKISANTKIGFFRLL